MTETTVPTYALTSLTDEQWDKQLAAQQEMQRAELEVRKTIELERLRNERDVRRGRSELIPNILGGLAVFLVVVLFVVGGAYAIQASAQRGQEKAIECIRTNGLWVDEGAGEGERCERP